MARTCHTCAWVEAKSGTTVRTQTFAEFHDGDDDRSESPEHDTDVDAESDLIVDKDLSNVRIGLTNGEVLVFEGLSTHEFQHVLGEHEIAWVIVKAGTSVRVVTFGEVTIDHDDVPGYLRGEIDTTVEGDVEVPAEDEVESETDLESETETDSEVEGEAVLGTPGEVTVETGTAELPEIPATVTATPEGAAVTGVLGADTTAPVVAQDDTVSSTAAFEQSQSEELPYTGSAAGLLAGLGAVALAGGAALRRVGR